MFTSDKITIFILLAELRNLDLFGNHYNFVLK